MPTDQDRSFEELLALPLAPCPATLLFGRAAPDEDALLPVLVDLSAVLSARLGGLVEAFLRAREREYLDNDLLIRPYDPQAKGDSTEVEYERAADAPDVTLALAALARPHDAPHFSGREKDLPRGLKCYVITLTLPNGETLTCLRHYGPQHIIRPGNGLLAIFNRGVYEALDSPALQIDEVFDAILWHEHIFVFERDPYEKLFRMGPLVRQQGREALAALSALGVITPMEKFERSCLKDPRKYARLRIARLKGLLAPERFADMGLVRAIIQDYGLALEVREVAGREAILFGNKAIWELLRLLSDDFVQSPLTGNRYEANSKRPRSG